MTRDWTTTFNETFRAPASAVQARVFAEVLGEEHVPGLDAHSYVTASELQRIAQELRVGRGDLVGDLGCGRGGPGLWVAGQTGARLIGIDLAASAVAAAEKRAAALGLEDRAQFRVGTFQTLGLEDGELDAALSIDAFLFAPDKAAAAHELARVLRPGGHLVMTTWDYHHQPEGRPPQVDDHRPLLSAAGFTILAYEETARWREHQNGTTDGLLAAVHELAAETGEDPDELHAGLTDMHGTFACMKRRAFIVARRT